MQRTEERPRTDLSGHAAFEPKVADERSPSRDPARWAQAESAGPGRIPRSNLNLGVGWGRCRMPGELVKPFSGPIGTDLATVPLH